MNKKHIFFFMFAIALTAVSYLIFTQDKGDAVRGPKAKGRWYTEAQVSEGQKIFQNNCAACHGSNAQGSFNWKKPLANGSYPPPPLNGTGHAWHHPMPVLEKTIKLGGNPIGGTMPSFGDKLSPEEIRAVIAFFQNEWNQEIYEIWVNKVNK